MSAPYRGRIAHLACDALSKDEEQSRETSEIGMIGMVGYFMAQ